MIVATLTASAQNVAGGFSIKPMAGVSFATITNDKDAKMKVGFVGGAEAEYGISNRFGIAAGVVYSMQGAKWSGDDIVIKNNENYLNIPVLAKFYIVEGLAIQAGVQPGFLLSESLSYNGTKEDPKYYISDTKKFDLSIPMGLTWEIANVVLDARYNLGVTNMTKSEKFKNSVITVTLGYRFRL